MAWKRVPNREDLRKRRREIYLSPRWRELRLEIIERDENICQACQRLIHATPYVDHIVAIHDGGAIWDPENLQTMCAGCHSEKTSQEVMSGQPGFKEWDDFVRTDAV